MDQTDDVKVFVPDALLPAMTAAAQPRLPELALLRAVLEDARQCFLGRAGKLSEQREAARWIDGTGSGEWGFEWICDELCLNASAVRKQFKLEQREGAHARWRVRGQVHNRMRCERRVA